MVKQININEKNTALPAPSVNKTTHDKSDFDKHLDPLLIAFLCIFHSVEISHESAAIQAKELLANVKAQNSCIDKEALFHFYTISQTEVDKIDKTKRVGALSALTTKNEVVSAMRNMLGDKLTVLKQNAQMGETKMNTVTNEDQQGVSEGSKLLSMLVSLTNQIAQI